MKTLSSPGHLTGLPPFFCPICPLPRTPGSYHQTHSPTLSLFAEYMVIYLSKPAKPLPQLINMIIAFSTISGFSINYNKMELYPISFLQPTQLPLQNLFKFCWVTKSWICLGVSIPLNLKDLYILNFGTLLSKVHTSLQDWNKQQLS